MRRKKRFRYMSLGVVILADIFLFVGVFILMNYVQKLLQNDVEINLTEIVTQNKDVITTKLSLEFNDLDSVASQLADRYGQMTEQSPESLKLLFERYVKEKKDTRLFIALEGGQAIFPDGRQRDISGRLYYRLAMEGKQNVSERTTSRLDGTDIFVISVPLEYQGAIVGTVQKQYTPEQMYDICSVSLFSEQGYVYIINREGYILISSEQNEYKRESDNYYRILYKTSPEASKQLQTDIQNEHAGFMQTKIDGRPVFFAYTPLETAWDWYLISSVDTTAVSPNANIVIRLFYCVLLVLALLFMVSLFYYIRLKRKQQANLEQIAFVDNVTGGSSYAKFQMDLQTLLEKMPEKPLAVFTFDIDNFKYINSVYGFETGDRILQGVNALYAEQLREDERIARIYNDHFVMLLSDFSSERLKELFHTEISVEGVTIYLSAGLYPIKDVTESINLMVDKAVMTAQTVKGIRYKEIGVYSEQFDKEMQHSEETKRAVELALADNEIVAYYQPKVDINTGRLVGAEALARWKKKDGSLIPPGEFIPVCEKTGLIVSVDMAIFEHTLRFIRKNMDKGVPCVPISVNFSRMHLLNQDFLTGLLSKLQEYDVPPAMIELELTESVLFDNYQQIEDFISKLHECGLQIAMDDFGSGYSSLHMLKDMDIDVLKIDRGFLQGTAGSFRQKAVFASIAQMAKKLQMQVVVEGVETLENVQLMKEYDCAIAQGYYYSRPIPEAEFDRVVREGKI